MREAHVDPITALIARINDIRLKNGDREETRLRLRDARTSLAQALLHGRGMGPRPATQGR